MIAILRSRPARAGLLIVGFALAVLAVGAYSVTYRYSLDVSSGTYTFYRPVWLLAAVACAAVFVLSVLSDKRKKPAPPWRRADITLLAVLAYCAVMLSAYVVRNVGPYTRFYLPVSVEVLAFSAAAYTATMGLLAETAARWRDGTLISGMRWPRFFKLYPPRRPVGLLMLLLLAWNLFGVLAKSPEAFFVYVSPELLTALFVHAFTLVALTSFCRAVLSLAGEFERANAEKIRAERFKAELITNVSHDIRTPLTSIISYVDLLKKLPLQDADFRSYTEVLEKKAARLKALLGDLIDAAKAGTGSMSVNLRPLDLCEVMGQLAGDFDEAFAGRGLQLVTKAPETPVWALADDGHLSRALENLFVNAVKFACPGTRVFAEVTGAAGAPAFILKNISQTPIDIPADQLTEQFMRGDRARQTEGSGLGLYIAKSLTELCGGTFDLRVDGDMFTVTVGLRQP